MEKKSFHRFRKWNSFPCRAVCLWGGLVYDGHLAPKVQADGSFDFATPVEELFK